jgi:hypothetical protein
MPSKSAPFDKELVACVNLKDEFRQKIVVAQKGQSRREVPFPHLHAPLTPPLTKEKE